MCTENVSLLQASLNPEKNNSRHYLLFLPSFCLFCVAPESEPIEGDTSFVEA